MRFPLVYGRFLCEGKRQNSTIQVQRTTVGGWRRPTDKNEVLP